MRFVRNFFDEDFVAGVFVVLMLMIGVTAVLLLILAGVNEFNKPDAPGTPEATIYKEYPEATTLLDILKYCDHHFVLSREQQTRCINRLITSECVKRADTELPAQSQ